MSMDDRTLARIAAEQKVAQAAALLHVAHDLFHAADYDVLRMNVGEALLYLDEILDES